MVGRVIFVEGVNIFILTSLYEYFKEILKTIPNINIYDEKELTKLLPYNYE